MKKFFSIKCLLVSGLIIAMATCGFAADDLSGAFKEGKIRGDFRAYYFQRDFEDQTVDMADFAMGGQIYYKTAPLKGISAGIAFYTSNDMGSDDNKNVYGLLAKENGKHASYTALGEYYLQGEWFNTTFKVGAQEINTPFLNKRDIRMTPYSYKAVSVVNKSIPDWVLYGYHVTDFKGLTDTDFKDISRTLPGVTEDEDVTIGGLVWKPSGDAKTQAWDKLSVELWDYYAHEIMNSVYLRAKYSKSLNNVLLRIVPSYYRQNDVGDKLIGALDTYAAGVNVSLSAFGAVLSTMYGQVGDDGLVTPWGYSRVMTQQIFGLTRAEEKAYGVKLGYDFGNIGAKGLSAYVFYANYDTPEDGSNASFDLEETDFNIEYKFSGALKGFSLRGRYARIDQDQKLGGKDFNDARVYVRYQF